MNKQLLELWVRLTADPKKSGALGVLVVLGLVMWARAALISGGGPAAAAGSVAVNGGGDSDVGNERGVGAREIGVITLPGLEPLTRDLFSPDEAYFPLPVQTELLDAQAAKSATGSDDRTEEHKESAQQLAARIDGEAGKLRLRSTIVGTYPIAIIEPRESRAGGEGRVLRPGDEVAGFRLEEVFSRRVVLLKEGVRVELLLEAH